jgi:hypothetical protein
MEPEEEKLGFVRQIVNSQAFINGTEDFRRNTIRQMFQFGVNQLHIDRAIAETRGKVLPPWPMGCVIEDTSKYGRTTDVSELCDTDDETNLPIDVITEEQIPKEKLIRIRCNGILRCYNIDTLVETLSRKAEDPFTRTPVTQEFIDEIMKRQRKGSSHFSSNSSSSSSAGSPVDSAQRTRNSIVTLNTLENDFNNLYKKLVVINPNDQDLIRLSDITETIRSIVLQLQQGMIDSDYIVDFMVNLRSVFNELTQKINGLNSNSKQVPLLRQQQVLGRIDRFSNLPGGVYTPGEEEKQRINSFLYNVLTTRDDLRALGLYEYNNLFNVLIDAARRLFIEVERTQDDRFHFETFRKDLEILDTNYHDLLSGIDPVSRTKLNAFQLEKAMKFK